MELLLVSDELVRQSITAEECLAAVEAGFQLHARRTTADTQARLTYKEDAVGIYLYAAQVPGYGLAAKVLGACEHNPALGEPYIHAVVIVMNPDTGRPQALLDGRYLTALRTAAATALGARYLGRSDSQVLGILGTGLQARTHLLCHLAAWPFEKVVVWGRNTEHVQAYLSEMRTQVATPIVSLSSAEAVCEVADVISCTTRARTPLFSAKAVRPGTHIGVAGSLRSGATEIPLELVRRSCLFVDSREKFRKLWKPGTDPVVEAELGKVICGATVGRVANEAVTIFKPVGMAFEDCVSARIVVDRVRRNQSGEVVPW